MDSTKELQSENKTFKGFNGNQLKLFAIIAMTIDHLTCVIWPCYNYQWWILLLHLIGRLTAPTMWFMVAEGFYYTKNVKKYIFRLFIFAVFSHFAYNFAFGIPFIPFKTTFFNQTSVMWALAWAVVFLYLSDDSRHEFKLKEWQKILALIVICFITFPSDWSCFPVLCTSWINRNRGNLKRQIIGIELYLLMYTAVWIPCIDVVYGILQLGVVIVWPFMANYNGQRGKWKGMKWFFYLYYPLHLILVGFLRLYLNGNISVIIGG